MERRRTVSEGKGEIDSVDSFIGMFASTPVAKPGEGGSGDIHASNISLK